MAELSHGAAGVEQVIPFVGDVYLYAEVVVPVPVIR